MENKNWIISICLAVLLAITSSCSIQKNSETDDLRKEVETMKKEREDEKAAKEKAETEKQQAANTKEQAQTNKAAATPTPKPKVSAPVGSTVAYCNGNNVVVRNSPSLNAGKVNALKKGEKVFVIEESDNYDEWNGKEANWAYIQKENGERGWVFTPFISYQ